MEKLAAEKTTRVAICKCSQKAREGGEGKEDGDEEQGGLENIEGECRLDPCIYRVVTYLRNLPPVLQPHIKRCCCSSNGPKGPL